MFPWGWLEGGKKRVAVSRGRRWRILRQGNGVTWRICRRGGGKLAPRKMAESLLLFQCLSLSPPSLRAARSSTETNSLVLAVLTPG